MGVKDIAHIKPMTKGAVVPVHIVSHAPHSEHQGGSRPAVVPDDDRVVGRVVLAFQEDVIEVHGSFAARRDAGAAEAAVRLGEKRAVPSWERLHLKLCRGGRHERAEGKGDEEARC